MLLAACVQVKAGYYGDDVHGADVERVVDTQLAQYLTSYDSKLRIGRSECPATLDVSKGRVAYCTLPVDGVGLRVKVVYSGQPPQGFTANLDGDFYKTAQIESTVEKQLSIYYGIDAKAHCPGAAVQTFRPGTRLSCSVTGTPLIKVVHLMTLAQGNIQQSGVPGLKPRATLAADAIAKHKRGQPVHLSGRELVEYLNRAYLPLFPNRAMLAVSCPEDVDLTGKKRAVCLLNVRDKDVSQRIGVWIDSGGFHSIPIDALIDKRRVTNIAEQNLNSALADHGLPPDAAIDCGSGYAAVRVQGELRCSATVSRTAYVLLVTVKDYHGAVQMRLIAASPKPSPT
jgi:hypothetical protein